MLAVKRTAAESGRWKNFFSAAADRAGTTAFRAWRGGSQGGACGFPRRLTGCSVGRAIRTSSRESSTIERSGRPAMFLAMQFEALVSLLEADAARFRVIEHPAEGRSELVAQIRGTAPGQGAKAMLCRSKDGDPALRGAGRQALPWPQPGCWQLASALRIGCSSRCKWPRAFAPLRRAGAWHLRSRVLRPAAIQRQPRKLLAQDGPGTLRRARPRDRPVLGWKRLHHRLARHVVRPGLA